ncbi:hypothetical protein BSKO_12587 [Bryopsis sp. KO-2023]|nr:hypothetical protein BSKO_12587 [Bryopsis sp. KO-2023]
MISQLPNHDWRNASTVAPPLIYYFHERRDDGENFREWILKLRTLNKSWYLEVTDHIQKVSVYGDQLEHLPRSLQGSLAHVTNLALIQIGFARMTFDEEEGSLTMCEESSACAVLHSAVNIRTLSLADATELENEFDALMPMTSVKTVNLKDCWSLAIAEKCPNLDNLTVVDCLLAKTKFQCNPRLRSLSIDSPDTRGMRMDNPNICRVLADVQWGQWLANDLANLTQLTQLRFSAGYQAVCETLGSLKHLKVLSVLVKNVSPFGVEDRVKHGFLNALPPLLRELEVWGLLSWEDHRVLMKTTSLGSLEKLTLGNGADQTTYIDLEWVTKLPNLVELPLWGGELKRPAFDWLRCLRRLRRVALNVWTFIPKAVEQLCRIGSNITQIEVCYRNNCLENDPVGLEAKRLLETEGFEVKLVSSARMIYATR